MTYELPHDVELQLQDPSSPLMDDKGVVQTASKHGIPRNSGGTSTLQTFVILLKAFIGTGVLLLPAAWSDGGFIMANALYVVIAVWCTYNIYVLVQCKRLTKEHDADFGRVAEVAWGKRGRYIIDIFVCAVQLAVVAVYFDFVASNLRSSIGSLSMCKVFFDTRIWIAITLGGLLPFVFIRHVKFFAPQSYIANGLILTGLIYMYYNDIDRMTKIGVANVKPVAGWKTFSMCIGQTVFAFEGIQLCLPVERGMVHRQNFMRVVYAVAGVCTVIYMSFGTLGYMAFGPEVMPFVLLSAPAGYPTSTIQLLYAIAIYLSLPVQFFPAVQIIEKYIEKSAGLAVCNIVRTVLLAAMAGLAAAGSSYLGSFVTVLSSAFALPMAFMFPSLIHIRMTTNRRLQYLDFIIIIAGAAVSVFCVVTSIQSWSASEVDVCSKA